MSIRPIIAFCLCMALTLSCNKSSSQARQQQQVLSLNISTEPSALDPGIVHDITALNVTNLLFDGLTCLGEDSIPCPAVAEHIDVSADGKTYTFHLRSTRWSNGDLVTAYDFEYAWKRQLAPAHPGLLTDFFYIIKNAGAAKQNKVSLSEVGIRVIDDFTLVVELENPAPYFLELVQLSPFYPVHRSTTENPNWANEAGPNFISNGPFVLDRWDHDNKIEVKRNDLYWDKEAVKLNRITMSMVNDSHTTLGMFEKGEIDWAGSPLSSPLPFDAISSLRATGALKIHPMASNYSIVFNIERWPFHNSKLRRALAYAINRDELVRHVTKGGELVATTPLAPPLTRIEGEGFKDGDIAMAQQLLNEALEELGTTREGLGPLFITHPQSIGDHQLLQAIQQQWRIALGLNVQLNVFEWSFFLTKARSHDFAITKVSTIPAYNDPFAVLLRFRERDGRNFSGWVHPEFVRILEAAEVSLDPAERDRHLRNAEAIMLEEMPHIPVYTRVNNSLIHPQLKGIIFHPLGWVGLKSAYFE